MSRDAKTKHRVRRILRLQGYSNPQKIIDSIIHDIPNVRLPKVNNKDTYKFLEGITRFFTSKELSSAQRIMEINQILKLIADDTHVNEYDYNLNGLSYSQIINRFKTISRKNHILEEKNSRSVKYIRNPDYDIIKIDSFEKAELFAPYTSWCITTSKNMYNSYTNDGLGTFYFIAKKGFQDIKQPKFTTNCLDEYGKSLIAVSVTMEGSLNTCTCRYNHSFGGNDSIMSRQEIEKLIGISFFDAFPRKSKEELLAMGVSEWLGKVYTDPKSGNTGIVIRVDENDNPKTLMSCNFVPSLDGKLTMNYEEALKVVKNSNWRLCTEEDIKQLNKFKNIINARIQMQNDEYEVNNN